MGDSAPIWVLLGQRTGDNNQLLRLASEIGPPFRRVELRYNALRLLPPALIGPSLASLDEDSRAQIRPPWPELVLGIGHRSVPAALAIREKSGGKAKLVRLGNPRLHPRNFDLVITTSQYRVPQAPNVLLLPVGIATAPPLVPDPEEQRWLARLPRPHRLLLIGGDTFMWSLDPRRVARAAAAISQKSGGSVIAASSPRSDPRVLMAVADALRGSEHALVWGRFPRYPVLLAGADEIYVTADSVAMASDAVATGKPVGLVDPAMTFAGRVFYGLSALGMPVPVRDIRRFRASLAEQGLAGTVERPVEGRPPEEPLAVATAAVRRLLGAQAARASLGSQPR